MLFSGALVLGMLGYRPSHLTLSDSYRLVGLSSPRISADGKLVILVRSRVDLESDKRVSELVLVDVASRTERDLVGNQPTVAEPQWSPHDRRLAFLADDANKKKQVWVLSIGHGAARQITSASGGVEQYAWRPDGNAIAFLTPNALPKRTGIARWQDAFAVTNNGYLDRGPFPPSHLWLTQTRGDNWSSRRLTDGTWSVASGAAPSTISWSPDGKTLACVRLPNALLGDANRSSVEELDVGSGRMTPLAGRIGLEFNPRFSPDGRYVAYTRARDGDPMNEADIFLSRRHAVGKDISRAIGSNTTDYAWYLDSRALLVEGDTATQRALWRLNVDGSVHRLDLGGVNAFGDFDGSIARDGSIAFVGSTSQHPAEIYYLPAGGKLLQLTNENAGIAARDLGRTATLAWKGPNGFLEDGVLTYPVDYARDRRYPLVVLIHGGPTEASVTSFDTLAQLMAARRWFVLEPNYRGSDNLGNAYQHAIYKDATKGPAQDILAGVRAAETMHAIDPRRICVSGWSYGGTLTSWLITQDRRWACAVAGAAVDDLVYDYSLADDISSDRAMGGSPFINKRLRAYRAVSPLTFYRNVITPTLILSDMYDVRVPAAQSYAFYHALHDIGTPVEFYEWPVRDHFPGDPVRTADVYRYWIDWIERHVRSPR